MTLPPLPKNKQKTLELFQIAAMIGTNKSNFNLHRRTFAVILSYIHGVKWRKVAYWMLRPLNMKESGIVHKTIVKSPPSIMCANCLGHCASLLLSPPCSKKASSKHYGTPGSQVITQPSTDGAHSRLSSQFWWEGLLSWGYDRSMPMRGQTQII